MQRLSFLRQVKACVNGAVFSALVGAPFTLTAMESLGQEATTEVGEDKAWFRTEVLIFVRSNEDALRAESWEPMPTLSYPDKYRFLIEPTLHDQRLKESGAFESQLDNTGIQQLTVTAPETLLELVPRPDLIFSVLPAVQDDNRSSIPEDPNEVIATSATAELSSGEDLPFQGERAPDAGAVPGEGPEPEAARQENEVIPDPIPFLEVAADSRSFERQATQLRRQGHEVLFHKAWWAPLQEQEETLPILIERSGDPDVASWPRLQGTVSVYLSRYLHAVVDLWVNTDASYLPTGWRIDAPPLAPRSVISTTIGGTVVDPWALADPTEFDPALVDPTLPPTAPALGQHRTGAMAADAESFADESQMLSAESQIQSNGAAPSAYLSEREFSPLVDGKPEVSLTEVEQEARISYPWRHAIRHQQSRRMRGGEIHYLDHPVIGVLVRVDAQEEGLAPPSSEPSIEFRARHGLPLPVSSKLQTSLTSEKQVP